MKCASYTRTVSCLRDGDIPKDIINQQNQKIQEYIKRKNWTLVKKYSDRKKDEFEDTAFLQMKQDAIGREFDCVVIDSMFRCGRNANVAAELFRNMFVPAGIYFAVVEDDFCSCEVSDGETNTYLEEKVKEYRSFTVNADMRKYNETKKFPKYGYRYKDGKMELEIDPYAAENVRKIFQLICDGKSFKEAATVMTEEGIMSSGNYIDKLWGRKVRNPNEPWKRDQIKRIVYNRLYLGEWTRTIDAKKVTIPCPRIIDEDTFNKAKTVLAGKLPDNHSRRIPTCNPFAGKIFDKESGIPLKLYPHQRLKIQVFRVSYPKPEEIKYERGHIPYEEVYSNVCKLITREIKAAERISEMIGTLEWQYEKEKQIQKIKDSAQIIFRKMLEVEGRNLPLYQAMRAGHISEEEYEIQKAQNIHKFAEYDEMLQQYLEQLEDVEKCYSGKNPWIVLFAKAELPEEVKREEVKKWIDRIDCIKYEYVEICFKYQEWKEKFPRKWFEEERYGTKK